MNILGTDVSHWQGVMNWQKAKLASIDFAFVKATQGRLMVDDQLVVNVANLQAAGIPFGCYHYYTHDATPAQQAARFLNNCAGGLPPVLDIEEKRGVRSGLSSRVYEWLSIVMAETERRPIIYTSPGFWNSYLYDATWADAFPLWIANYTTTAPQTPLPWQPTRWHFWQFTAKASGGKYGAQSKSIDLNVFNGTIADLLNL